MLQESKGNNEEETISIKDKTQLLAPKSAV